MGVVQWLAHQLVELKTGVQFPSPTHMSNKFEQLEIIRRFIDKTIENNFFPELEGVSVASIAEASRKTGLAPNLIYRLLLSEELKIDGLVVSVKKEKLPKQRDQAESLIWGESQRYQRRPMFLAGARAKLTKPRILAVSNNVEVGRAKITLVKRPQDTKRNDTKERLAKRWISRSERTVLSPEEKFFAAIQDLSLFPIQNPDVLRVRIEERIKDGRVFRFGCFVCLNTKCRTVKEKPVFFLGQEENRLTTPKLMRRTQKLIGLLEATYIPFNVDILIADTDIYDVNGDWLATPDQTSDINAYLRKLTRIFSGVSPNLNCKLWSEIQAPYESQYRRDFDNVYRQFIGSNDEQVVTNILKRKRSLIEQGVPNLPELEKICRITAERNFALYAAQGPIINSEYDCLIMADPEPLRLGAKQSQLCPQLPIWYPYPG